MRLSDGRHLSYCTNIHRGESWEQILRALEQYTLAVRDRVCPDHPFAIGLRLSNQASCELMDGRVFAHFQKWLERHNCYVFTINGFPFGQFHGGRVKEQVYLPDWSSPERLVYTKRLFQILAGLVPAGVEGSVSTVPIGFKEFLGEGGMALAREHLFECVKYVSDLSDQTGRKLHLGLEPEPLCCLETTREVIEFFDQFRTERGSDPRINRCLGINYDTCHLAVEFEEPAQALAHLHSSGVLISKIHLSSALRVSASAAVCAALAGFADETYLHQVMVRSNQGDLIRYKDLPAALQAYGQGMRPEGEEWRIHFHVPLHSPETELFGNTRLDLLAVLQWLRNTPGSCSHLEMETYTWEVMPPDLKARSVVEQLAAEYDWCLGQMRQGA